MPMWLAFLNKNIIIYIVSIYWCRIKNEKTIEVASSGKFNVFRFR